MEYETKGVGGEATGIQLLHYNIHTYKIKKGGDGECSHGESTHLVPEHMPQNTRPKVGETHRRKQCPSG